MGSFLSAEKLRRRELPAFVVSVAVGAPPPDASVLPVHHHRTAGGEDGDAVRGSGAILAGVDASIEIERMENAPSHRRLVAVGRWSPPPVLVIDHDPATEAWGVIGQVESREEAATLGYQERVLAALPSEPPGITEAELAEVLDVDGRKVMGPLRELVKEDRVTRSGEGKRGSPYTYAKALPKSSPGPGENRPLKCSPSLPRRVRPVWMP